MILRKVDKIQINKEYSVDTWVDLDQSMGFNRFDQKLGIDMEGQISRRSKLSGTSGPRESRYRCNVWLSFSEFKTFGSPRGFYDKEIARGQALNFGRFGSRGKRKECENVGGEEQNSVFSLKVLAGDAKRFIEIWEGLYVAWHNLELSKNADGPLIMYQAIYTADKQGVYREVIENKEQLNAPWW